MPIPHSGDSLCVEAVPSLQCPQPGSEHPKLTAERRMQQNRTSTQSRQKHIQPEGHLDICSIGILVLWDFFHQTTVTKKGKGLCANGISVQPQTEFKAASKIFKDYLPVNVAYD